MTTEDSRRNQRRSPRVPHELAVTLQFPNGPQHHFTQNISYQGIFIVCDAPLPLRKLVRFTANLGDDEPTQLLGMVAHHISQADGMEHGTDPGMGIALFSVGPEGHARWCQFVRDRYEHNPKALTQVRQRELPHVRVHAPGVEELRQFALAQVAQGEVFLYSAEVHPVGTRVWFETNHPDTKKPFRIEATVTEAVEAPRQSRGVRLAFDDAQATSQALANFAQAGEQG